MGYGETSSRVIKEKLSERVPPIDRARVRELRETERKTASPFPHYTNDGGHSEETEACPGCVYERAISKIRALRITEKAMNSGDRAWCDGVAALRNAAEPTLDLLEALLEERRVRIAHWQRQHHEVEIEFAAVNDALAAFVEGTDAA